jgi:hypothetical protein
MGSPLSEQERSAYPRCFAVALLVLGLSLGGEALFGGPRAADSCPVELNAHVQRALARVAPQLPLVQLGQYLGRALVSRLYGHDDCPA